MAKNIQIEKIRRMLKNRRVPYRVISEQTGISIYWLQSFGTGRRGLSKESVSDFSRHPDGPFEIYERLESFLKGDK